MVPETSVYSPFNHLTRLLAREYFIEHFQNPRIYSVKKRTGKRNVLKFSAPIQIGPGAHPACKKKKGTVSWSYRAIKRQRCSFTTHTSTPPPASSAKIKERVQLYFSRLRLHVTLKCKCFLVFQVQAIWDIRSFESRQSRTSPRFESFAKQT